MKYVFVFLMVIHGFIHLIGFVGAFFSTSIEKQILGISRPSGVFWLVAFVLFLISTTQFFFHKKWFYVAFIAILLSQILIVVNWKEAKYGTIINTVLLIVSLSAYGTFNFQNMVEKESVSILDSINVNRIDIVTKNDIEHLPLIVKKWMHQSGVLGRENIANIRLKQRGKLRTQPDKKWMPFTASQYFNCSNPSFIWVSRIKAMPAVHLIGRDKLLGGKGEMLIKLAGLIPVVNETENKKINQGAMVRYLAEISWFPTAAINENIIWEKVESNSAKATLTTYHQSVSGIFKFNENGQLLSFEAQRYYGGKENSNLETWTIENLEYKQFNGIEIPTKSNVTWQLKDGDFHWLTIEISEIDYNILEPYEAAL